jgi:hypothetical protein
LFKTFFDANTAREFLQNGSNFKDTERFNFQVRWFKSDDEFLISDCLKSKMGKFSSKFLEMHNKGINQNFNNNAFGYYNNNNWNMTEFNMKAKNFNIGQNMGMQMGMHNMQMPMHMQSMQNLQMQNINNNMNNMSLNQMNSGNNSFNSFSKHNSTTNVESEEKKSQPMQNGKYTCRFEIQIENDKEFQVARRLIGAKVILINPGL